MAAALPDASGQGDRPGPAISVIVVNWRRTQATIDCARAVRAWRSLRPVVLVVDNGSGSEVADRLRRELDGTEVIASDRNLGFGGANNKALERISSEFVLLLNNDAQISDQAVASLLGFLRQHPEAGIAGPVLESSTPPHAVIAAGGRDLVRHGRTHESADERADELRAGRPYAVDYVPGTAALVRTALLERLGGFDEEYFFSGEMADLCARASDAGSASFIVPAARARHDLGSAAHLRNSLYSYYSLRNRFLYARRREPRPMWPLIVWTLRGMAGMIVSLATGRRSRARSQRLALIDGLRGRFGPADERLST